MHSEIGPLLGVLVLLALPSSLEAQVPVSEQLEPECGVLLLCLFPRSKLFSPVVVFFFGEFNG